MPLGHDLILAVAAKLAGEQSLKGARITEAEELISDLEDKRVVITTTEKNKEKGMKRAEDSPRDL